MPDPRPLKIFLRVARLGGFGRAAKRPPADRLTGCAPIRHRDWRRRPALGMFPAMSDHPRDLRLAFRAGRTGTTAALPLVIGHAPGSMLITDVRSAR